MRRSGKWLLLMALWWVIPFFVIHLLARPFLPSLNSHLFYVVLILVALGAAAVVSAVDGKRDLWRRSGYWGKYGFLCGAYAVQGILALVIVVTLDSLGLIGYYGGDAAGSIGMLIVPSILAYFVLGGITGGVLALVKGTGKRGRPGASKEETELDKQEAE